MATTSGKRPSVATSIPTSSADRCCRLSTRTIVVAFVVVACIVCSATLPAEGFMNSARSCQFNKHMRVENVNLCKYGWEVDACSNKICTKGPAEVCGGKHMRYGICGEGLMCNNCNRCQVRTISRYLSGQASNLGFWRNFKDRKSIQPVNRDKKLN